MVSVKSSHKPVKNVLKKINDICLEHGAIINKDVEIICEDNNLMVRNQNHLKQNKLLLLMPSHCLLPIDEFSLNCKGDSIIIDNVSDKLTDLQVNLLESVIELYNLTDKLKAHKKTYPWISRFHDKELFENLFKGRTISEEDEGFLNGKENNIASSALYTFIKTRVLGSKQEIESEENVRVIMPIVDYLNHHPKALPFSNSFNKDTGKMSLRVFDSRPVNSECFACYGRFDAYDTFIHYGYVEPCAPFVRSIPLELNIKGLGMLKVRSLSGHYKHKDLPESVKDLHAFIPPFVVDDQKGEMTCNYLFIPSQGSPFALCRVLGVIFSTLMPELSEDELKPYIVEAEEQIIRVNLSFYNELEQYLKNYDKNEGDALVKLGLGLCQIQLEKLQSYSSPF